MHRVYLDTSAYLCTLLGEKSALQLQKFLQRKTLCSSVLLFIEAERNLIRYSREKIMSADDCSMALLQLKNDHELFTVCNVTWDLCLNSEYPPVRIPRSGDLIHLRTAKWFQHNGGLDSFVTLDDAQRMSAIDMGLPAVSL